MFEEWVTDSPFIISPRITFEVSVRLLGGLMALGYSIATILKRSSHVFSDERVTIKIDWLEQLNRHYIQVQGRDRMYVRYIADELGLEGSYIPRTYIEQIQLEKLVTEVTALPDDLKTQLSIDDELTPSPKEALSRASADRVSMGNKIIKSGLSQSYSTQRDQHLSKLTKLTVGTKRLDGRIYSPVSPAINQRAISQLMEHISMLSEKIDEFTSRIEELNSKFSTNNLSVSQQNLHNQTELCNGSEPTSLFMSNLGNGTIIPNSSSCSQLSRENQLHEEIQNFSRVQKQTMHQLENLMKVVQDRLNQPNQRRNNAIRTVDFDALQGPLIIMLAVGSIGFYIMKRLSWT